eukprot:1386027-Amorphochlora_amoeboformis.AAC.1
MVDVSPSPPSRINYPLAIAALLVIGVISILPSFLYRAIFLVIASLVFAWVSHHPARLPNYTKKAGSKKV